jgi:hypothetical protein
MFTECQQWRKTVEGVGVDRIYQEIDPWDVSPVLENLNGRMSFSSFFQYPERESVFKYWPT